MISFHHPDTDIPGSLKGCGRCITTDVSGSCHCDLNDCWLPLPAPSRQLLNTTRTQTVMSIVFHGWVVFGLKLEKEGTPNRELFDFITVT